MTSRPRIGLIWAQAEGGVIGRDGGMPWHVPEDLAHFKAITMGSPVVMGRATWDALAPQYRPLQGRRNIVVTRQPDWSAEGVEHAGSVDAALDLAGAEGAEWIWVIGGGRVFAETIGAADRLEVTELTHLDGFRPETADVRAPEVDDTRFSLENADPAEGEHTSRSGVRYRFLRYVRPAAA